MSRVTLSSVVIASLLLGGMGAGWAMVRHQPVSQQGRPERVVSVNMCADQIVMAVADRSQIAGVTRNADKPELSAAASQARGLRIVGTSSEEVLEIDPDLIVGMPVRRGAVLAGIANVEYPTLDLETATSFAGIERSVRAAAKTLGHVERGEAMLAGMRAELAEVPRNGRGRVGAYYQRRGFMTGTGTLIDDLMNRVGLVNLAGKLGKPPLSHLSLEELVASKPDFLIVESATDRVVDQGTEMLHHPAIAGIPRISIPQAWTVCGSPAYVRAARGISDGIAAYDQSRR